MIKIGTIKEIEKVRHLSKAIIEIIQEDVTILDEYYGCNRDINKDLGGYIVVIETEEDIKELEKGNLEIYTGICEYMEKLIIEGQTWVKVLFVLSSDFSIVVIGKDKVVKSHKINY